MYIVWWSIHNTQAKIMWVFCNSLLREGDRGREERDRDKEHT